MGQNIRFSVIVPMYNEEAVIEETYRRLKKVMTQTSDSYELIFINDGSHDRCCEMMKECAR
jgi:polyisoprenyl-phosphate glycosyltransferase